MANRLDSDQARQNVGPDLGPNCLQRLSTDDTSSKELMHLLYFSDGENNFFTAASINLQLSLFKGNF